ncbi:MAG: hypothetical protein LBS97_06665 [Treponema sp.]|jgi:hypothetical protein|nr:hypothetical protein [Treponema sp.]
MKEKTDYANWIPGKLLIGSGIVGIVSVVLFFLSFLMYGGVAILLARVALVLLAVITGELLGITHRVNARTTPK